MIRFVSSSKVGRNFVQRRVNEPDNDRQTVHRLEEAQEIRPLQRFELFEGIPAFGDRVGHDHALHDRQPLD